MPKFRINLRWTAIFLIIFVAVVSLGLTISLNIKKNNLLKLLTEPLTYQAKATRLFYIFPNTILLQDLVFTTRTSADTSNSIAIPLIAVQFSPWNIITGHSFNISTIVLNKANCTQTAIARFISENSSQLMTILSALPYNDISILIKEAQVHPGADDPTVNSLISNLSFTLKNHKFNGHGHIFHVRNNNPLIISFTGEQLKNGLRLTKLNLDKNNLSSSFWGETKGDDLLLQGYAFYSDHARSSIPKGFDLPFISRSRHIEDPTFEIIDIKARFRLKFPELLIDPIAFNLNNFPVIMRGSLSASSTPSLNLNIGILNAPHGPTRIKNFKQANFSIKGSLEKAIFKAQTALDIIFEQTKDAAFTLKKASFASNKAAFYFNEQRRFTTQLDQSAFLLTTLKGQHKISFDKLQILANLKEEKKWLFNLTSAMYGGKLQGQVRCDTGQLPLQISGNATYTELNALSLQELLETFSKVNGKLSGKLDFQSHPATKLTGDFLIKDGILQKFDFFKWMADTFNMPSLVNIPFSETAGHYWLSAQGSGLSDIHITSPDVGLEGYFNIDKNNLVSSKLALSLSRAILQESPKFRAILKMFDREVPSLIFDFQLSGNQDAMNFQWLQSEFKERIQSRIPNFVERMIDRKIDAILQGNNPDDLTSPSP